MPQVQARFRSHFEAHLPILLHLSVNPYGCAFFYRKVSLILYFTDILQGCVKHQECLLWPLKFRQTQSCNIIQQKWSHHKHFKSWWIPDFIHSNKWADYSHDFNEWIKQFGNQWIVKVTQVKNSKHQLDPAVQMLLLSLCYISTESLYSTRSFVRILTVHWEGHKEIEVFIEGLFLTHYPRCHRI